MVISIWGGYSNDYVIFGTTGFSPEAQMFKQKWGKITVATKDVYKMICDIADYVNNELGEECLFEVE